MIPNYPGCEKCPLRDRPPVYGAGSRTPDLIVVGEAPGSSEVALRSPFVGPSGKLLRQTLKACGVDVSRVYFTNACLCHPQGNKTPSITAVRACNARLTQELRELPSAKILSVGGTALSALLSPEKTLPITRYHGLGSLYWGRYYIPSYHPAAVIRDPNLFRDLYLDIQKLLTNSSPLPLPEMTWVTPVSPEEALEYLDALATSTLLSCDLETTGFSPIKNEILSIGLGALTETGEGFSVLLQRGWGVVEDPRVLEKLWSLFVDFSGPIVFHNIKFDSQFLQVFFQVPRIPFKDPWDTMLMQYAQDERGTGAEGDAGSGRGYHIHGLKDQARMRYDIPDYHFKFDEFYQNEAISQWVQGVLDPSKPPYDPSEEPLFQDYLKYHSLDLYTTLRLFEDLRRELEEESPRLLPLVRDHLVPGALFLARTELRGAPIDQVYLNKVRSEMEAELLGLQSTLDGISESLGLGVLNYQSPVQVRNFLHALGVQDLFSTEREALLLEIQKKTRSGEPKYSPEVLSAVHVLIDYRQKSRTLQKDIIGLLDRVDPDGKIRPDYLLHGASTGRLACRDPNLQNVPVLMGPIVRTAIISGDPDYILVEADESQLELRVAAWVSQDEKMMQTFKDGIDIHRQVAADMFKKPPEEITHHERYLAKYVDFGVIYGRGAKSLTEGWEAQYIVDNLGGKAWTLEEAEAFVQNFLDGVPGLRDWIQKQHAAVLRDHYVETAMGRRRRFPLITRETSAGIERQAVNTPIQSFGSDIVLAAAMRLENALPEGAEILPILVHDSVMFRVRRDLLDSVCPIIHRELETPPIPMNVLLVAEIKVGDSWGTMTKYTPGDPHVPTPAS